MQWLILIVFVLVLAFLLARVKAPLMSWSVGIGVTPASSSVRIDRVRADDIFMGDLSDMHDSTACR
jgi:hypothetical protein